MEKEDVVVGEKVLSWRWGIFFDVVIYFVNVVVLFVYIYVFEDLYL